MPTCRKIGCKNTIQEGFFYCYFCDKALCEQLLHEVDVILKPAAWIYVGRTNTPERRLLEQLAERGLNYLSIVHWAIDLEEADAVESWLIRGLRDKTRKLLNEGNGGDGRCAGPHQAIYVAWVPKQSRSMASIIEEFRPIQDSSLDAGRRVRPTGYDFFKTVHLSSSLTQVEAKFAGATWVREQRTYYASRKRYEK